MKSPISILLAFLVLLSTLSKTSIILSFELNQDYISKYLCENRTLPKIYCGGQCVLSKRLAAEAAKGEALRTILEKLEVPYFASPFAAELDGREVVSLLDKEASRPIPFWNYLRISGIFHPPAFI